MATDLHQLLRSLCWNSEWNYAVLWKLKHRARMVLTWEDGFYNNQYKLDPSDSKSFSEALHGLQDDHLAHDSLGLAVAKMSYHVYSLGEGIIGQVAVTGKHRWVFAGEHAMNSYSSLELCDGWQAQFAAGIKTIVVASVGPHGVIQFGSLNKVKENLQFLDHIRDTFSSLQEPGCHVQTPMGCSLPHMLQMSDISSRILNPDVLQDYSADISSLQKQLDDSSRALMSDVHLNGAVGLISKDGLEKVVGDGKLVQVVPEITQSVYLLNSPNYRSDDLKIRNAGANDNRQICCSAQSCLTENSAFYAGKLAGEKSEVRFKYFPADYSESAACSRAVFNGVDHPSEENINGVVASGPLSKQLAEENMEIFPEFNCLDTSSNLNPSFMFSAGTELHEALGPAFLKQCRPFPCEVEKPEVSCTTQMPEAIESSLLTTDSGADHLLEAVVANFCHRDALKRAKSFSTSGSMLTTERMPEPSRNTSHTMGSSCYSLGCSSLLEESTQNCLNSSDSCSIRSSGSACREQLVRSVEQGKPNKKRARPGENCRPRPRDRQLIQDRIKELRELVPNGSKCSIDSLLERTIKHMVYMQNVTKHSDKLTNCAKSKGCSEMGVRGSGYEQGSSWAVEVGGHMKICPILVENLNMNGQMLIEMLCEDCDHVLEITEAIRGLGLTILKGITDSHGDKTWMRFVVEGQSNRNLHRMDVLWSLVQILQSKTTV